MADERSFSDWESVKDSNASSTDPDDNTNGDNNDESSWAAAAGAVIVELPPGGITTKSNNNNKNGDDGHAGHPQNQEQHDTGSASNSSFSLISRVGRLGVDDTADSSSVMSRATTTTTEQQQQRTSVAISVASSYPWSDATPSDAESVITDNCSLVSQFDFISISGETMKRCRACGFHNAAGNIVCVACDMVLVAGDNPNIMSMDEQIAMHLQQKEEQDAQALWQQNERERKRLLESPAYANALVLAQDIRSMVQNDIDSSGPRMFFALPEQSLTELAVRLIEGSKNLQQARITFKYKYSPADASAMERIRNEGFPASINDRYGGVEAIGRVDVSNTVTDALESYERTRWMGPDGEAALFSIPEDQQVENKVCWIVAVLEQLIVQPNGLVPRDPTAAALPLPSQVLPLVYFDPDSCESASVSTILQKLQAISRPIFVRGLWVGLGPLPPPPAKKAKQQTSQDFGVANYTAAPAKAPIATRNTQTRRPPPPVAVRHGSTSDGKSQTLKLPSGIWVVAASSRYTLASGCDNRKVYLWCEDLGHYATLEGHKNGINAVAFSPASSNNSNNNNNNNNNSEWLASGDMAGVVKVWDTSHRTRESLLVTLDDNNRKPILDIRFFPSGKALAVVDWNRECRLWKLSDGKRTCHLSGHRPEVRHGGAFFLQAAAFRPDGQAMASAADGAPFIYFWRFNGSKELLNGHKATEDMLGKQYCQIRALAFSPDGRCLASSANDCSILFWDVGRDGDSQRQQQPRKETAIENIPKPVSCLAFSPDGRLLASGGDDHIVRLWDVETGGELRAFSGHSGSIRSVVFSPDGKTLISAGLDFALYFWTI